jgi:hypothetical protein
MARFIATSCPPNPKPARRSGVAALICLAMGATAWWLFGFETHRSGNGGALVLYRRWGRVTRIDVLDTATRPRERILFTWSEPYTESDPATECAAIFPERWLDMNGDGRWDTWMRRTGPDWSGHCSVEYQVDTKGTGAPDWTFVLGFSEYEKANQMMKARRGF